MPVWTMLQNAEGAQFKLFDDVAPAVTVYENFDSVLVPEDHVSRSRNDNYYLNTDNLLRAHTSAHQSRFIDEGNTAFRLAGDVYRRDEIDRSHYPVFHQMEGVRLFSITEINNKTGATVFANANREDGHQELHTIEAAEFVGNDLKKTLEGTHFTCENIALCIYTHKCCRMPPSCCFLGASYLIGALKGRASAKPLFVQC